MPESINSVRWADAHLVGVAVGYDDVTFSIRESSGRLHTIVASGHIGVKLVGFWDELVIECADVIEAHPFADECVRSVVERHGSLDHDTGSPARNSRVFSTLVISLSDGSLLHCAAASFAVETQST